MVALKAYMIYKKAMLPKVQLFLFFIMNTIFSLLTSTQNVIKRILNDSK